MLCQYKYPTALPCYIFPKSADQPKMSPSCVFYKQTALTSFPLHQSLSVSQITMSQSHFLCASLHHSKDTFFQCCQVSHHKVGKKSGPEGKKYLSWKVSREPQMALPIYYRNFVQLFRIRKDSKQRIKQEEEESRSSHQNPKAKQVCYLQMRRNHLSNKC